VCWRGAAIFKAREKAGCLAVKSALCRFSGSRCSSILARHSFENFENNSNVLCDIPFSWANDQNQS